MKFLSLIIIFFSHITIYSNGFATTHMLIMGGSGDPVGDKTIFDTGFSQLGDYYLEKSSRGEIGQASIIFDGGHKNTDSKKMKFKSSGHVDNFTNKTYEREIARFEKLMLNDRIIKHGDQLLIYINTHGAEKGRYDKNTHSIATGDSAMTDLNTGQGSTLVSLDALAGIKSIAKTQGIKLAIVDLSCHSGNTQKLADDNTCVVSATGPDHYAYSGPGFNGTFAKNLKRGENLESAFLKTRINDTTADFPMISTPEGKNIQDKIYDLLTPYLKYAGRADKLTPELIKTASDDGYACNKNYSFVQLEQLLTQIDAITTITKNYFLFDHKESIVDFENLQKSLQDYKFIQDNLARTMQTLHVEKLKKVEVIDSRIHYTWQALLSTDWDPLIVQTQNRLRSEKKLSIEDRTAYTNNLKIFQKAKATKKKILKETPTLINYQDVVKNFEHGKEQTKNLARKIAGFEKKLFNGLYKKYAQDNKKSNPCRDFKL